ncbi:MAG: hypothetical protein Q9M91_07030 [Candidatus Dojkabacteria bacterium]|nr:hypothetical protein [Candidatus Dojkabacteria bacterium]MDQ7021545.1 hypothetical protein [Candidatus Dojkabacteria bacterium]
MKIDFSFESIGNDFFERVKVLNIEDKKIWFDVVYGGAHMSELMHIGSMLGSKVNMFLGSVGELQKGSSSGDIIVPTYSYGEESSTKLYNRGAIDDCHYPDEELSEEVYKNISKEFNKKRGSLITCQATLGESWEDIMSWSKHGYVGVEMETATFFAVSRYFDIPSTALLYISDNLIEKETVNSTSHQNMSELRNQVRLHNYKLGLSTILSKF